MNNCGAISWTPDRVGMVCALICLSIGCGGSVPSAKPSATAPSAKQGFLFHRFTHETKVGGGSTELKAYSGNRDMNVLYAPYRTSVREVHASDLFRDHVNPARPLLVREDGSIFLRDIVDVSRLSEEAVGVAVAVKSNHETRHELISIPGGSVSEEEHSINLKALFEGDQLEVVEAWAREVLPLPREHRSERLVIPEASKLSFSIAFERTMQRRPGVPVQFNVTIEGEGFSDSIFTETLTPPSAKTWLKDAQWYSHDVDLSQYADKEVEFVFRTEFAHVPSETETTSPVWGNPVLYTMKRAEPPARPNIILVSLDTLRADHLGCYGYERRTSPNLDAFAQEAILFERCLAPSSWTTPSHASLFTGWAPFVHEAGGHAGYRLQPQFKTLAEAASEGDYLTAAFTEGGAVAGQLGFSQGFDMYENGPFGLETPAGTAETTFAQAKEWVQQFAHLPFFLFVHTYEIHWPYRVPGQEWQKFSKPGDVIETTDPMTFKKEEIERWRDHYDDGIAYTDHMFGEFMQSLDTQGVLDNTIVIVFSDHGEEFGEHQGASHGVSLYNEVLHVPFLIRLPGNNPAPVRVAEPIMLTDLFATVSELAKLSVVPPASSISLLPTLQNLEGARSLGRPYRVSHLVQTSFIVALSIEDNRFKYMLSNQYSLEDSPLSDFQRSTSPWTISPFERAFTAAIQEGEGSIIQPEAGRLYAVPSGSTQEFLFDWKQDADEQVNLAANPDFQDSVTMLRARLKEHIDALGENATSLGISVNKDTIAMTSEEKERLEALGYR